MKTIQVTQEDINRGRNCDCCTPIATAVARAFEDESWVSATYIAVGKPGGGLRRIRVPEVAVKFRADFDAGRPVQPFEFEVDL